jgi:DNA-binding CsgD family transcriptional regulator
MYVAAKRRSMDVLTPREREVLAMALQGYSRSQIARSLNLHETSVFVFVRASVRKPWLKNVAR